MEGASGLEWACAWATMRWVLGFERAPLLLTSSPKRASCADTLQRKRFHVSMSPSPV